LFGSALRDDFRPESDIDVLVTFAPETSYGLFDLVDMEDELEGIFGRAVDLVEKKSVEQSENYIRRKHILDSLEVIYVAR
jgi:predicted nucleotidyltransferase